MSDVYPFLAVRDVDAAVEFYAQALAPSRKTNECMRPTGPQVAGLSILGHLLGVATEAPELGTPSPETHGATTVRVSLVVDDPDALTARAIAAGAR